MFNKQLKEHWICVSRWHRRGYYEKGWCIIVCLTFPSTSAFEKKKAKRAQSESLGHTSICLEQKEGQKLLLQISIVMVHISNFQCNPISMEEKRLLVLFNWWELENTNNAINCWMWSSWYRIPFFIFFFEHAFTSRKRKMCLKNPRSQVRTHSKKAVWVKNCQQRQVCSLRLKWFTKQNRFLLS